MRRRYVAIALVFAAGLLLRLYFVSWPPTADMVNFQRSAEIFRAGGNIFTEQFWFNYSPLISVLLAPLSGPSFALAWRLVLSLGTFAAVLLLWRASGKVELFALAWLNPAMIFWDWWGSHDVLCLIPILAAVAYRWRDARLFAACAVAVLVKHNVVFLAWALLVYEVGWRRAALWMVGILAIFAGSFIPYLPAGAQRIVTRVLLYQSWGGYGFAIALSPLAARALFFGGMVLVPLKRPASALQGLKRAILAQTLLIYGSSFNAPALLLLTAGSRRLYAALSIVLALLLNPFVQMQFAQPNTWNAAWAVATVWAVTQAVEAVRGIKRAPQWALSRRTS